MVEISRAMTVLAVLVTACSGPGAGAPEPPPTPAPSPSPAPTPPTAPVPGPAATAAAQVPLRVHRVAMGSSRGCVVLAEGWVQCFRDIAPPHLETIARITDAVSVCAGDGLACAIREGGQVACWGDVPLLLHAEGATDLAGFERARDLACGDGWVCAIDDAGVVRCQGAAHWPPGVTADTLPPPAIVPDLPRALALTASGARVCAILEDDTRACWSERAGGDRGASITPSEGRETHAVGHDVSCWIVDGAVRCHGEVQGWGLHECVMQDPGDGQWLDCGPAPEAPVTIPLPARAVEVVVGMTGACARLEDDRVACWGDTGEGGGRGIRPRIIETGPVAELAVRTLAVCGVLRAGGVRCWLLPQQGEWYDVWPICRPTAHAFPCAELAVAPTARSVVAARAVDPAPATAPVILPARTRCDRRVADPSGTPLHVRRDASVRAEVVGDLEQSTPVEIAETRGRWARLSRPIEGWVWAESLAPCE